MPLIPILGRQRQVDLCEFRASLVYKVSFRTARLLHRETLSQKNKQTNKTNKQKPGMVGNAYNPGPGDVETGRSLHVDYHVSQSS